MSPSNRIINLIICRCGCITGVDVDISAVHRCGGEGWADGVVPRRGDSVEAVRVAVASKEAQEILVALRRPSQNPLVRV
jgi:hypothetical protein